MKCPRRIIPPALYTKNAETFFAPGPPGRTRSPAFAGSLACAPKPPRAALREARAGDVRRGVRWRACRFPRLGFPPGPLFRGAPFQADHHQGEKPIQGDTARLHLCLKGAARWVPAATTPLSVPLIPPAWGDRVGPSRGSRTRHRCGHSSDGEHNAPFDKLTVPCVAGQQMRRPSSIHGGRDSIPSCPRHRGMEQSLWKSEDVFRERSLF